MSLDCTFKMIVVYVNVHVDDAYAGVRGVEELTAVKSGRHHKSSTMTQIRDAHAGQHLQCHNEIPAKVLTMS